MPNRRHVRLRLGIHAIGIGQPVRHVEGGGDKQGWTRIYTESACNKKFSGWSNDGIRRFNELIKEVRENHNKQYSKEVEVATYKTLAERHKKMLRVKCKNVIVKGNDWIRICKKHIRYHLASHMEMREGSGNKGHTPCWIGDCHL